MAEKVKSAPVHKAIHHVGLEPVSVTCHLCVHVNGVLVTSSSPMCDTWLTMTGLCTGDTWLCIAACQSPVTHRTGNGVLVDNIALTTATGTRG